MGKRIKILSLHNYEEENGMCKYVTTGGNPSSSSFVYHRLILSTLFVGAMLWSMVQLRRGQPRMAATQCHVLPLEFGRIQCAKGKVLSAVDMHTYPADCDD